ncbi:S8 family peptidase [Fictibacillus barbaricus]|uniref:S8 family serine peptidase n=1 Tax=Fictibacillus barbaricus TaxID=182136 RepID=A0ABS2Z939_9BACL|nr:S8 family peptidase [Fictibacillus barbaricus]MBN3544698.1 S8 family serine peptidase [Fictibacillus barbaricus]GGB64681.1 bacillopeptidase F [Fictibacillus barbaricus]
MSKNKKKVRWLSVFLAFLMIVPLMFPSQANAATKEKPSTSAKKAALESSKNKVSKRLSEQFNKKDKVTFLIKFKEQVDTAEVAKKAAKKAKSQKLSANQSKLMKRSTLVSSLRAKALETQQHTKNYLEKQEKAGKAEKIQSFYVVNGMAVTATKEVMEEIAAFPEVEKVLPNETRQLIQPVSTIKLPEKQKPALQAEPENRLSSIEWNIERVGAPAVWDMGIDGSGTVVASIDTGVQWNHQALKEKYRGFNPQNPDTPDHQFSWFDAVSGQAAAYDDLGHGTHVTGTMVGSEPDGANQIGVAPGAKWIAVKAFNADGGTDVDLLEAGEWILAPKDAQGNPHPEKAPDVVNNSWGGGPGLDEWYREMVAAWRAAEIFPEFSAGNTTIFNPGGPGSVATPANYPESFATGATDINDRLASFSLQGPSPYDETKPEISAPGVNIRSSVPGSAYEGGWNGTSMAGPHVSAVAALLRQADASLTVEEMEEILLSSATPLTDATFPESPNNGYGHGLVNAFTAVSSVVTGLGSIEGTVTKEGEDTEAPSITHEGPSESYKEMPLTLEAQASDNISVTSVLLSYQNEDGSWTDIAAERTEGDYKSGAYTATIPGSALTGDQIVYKWKVNDFGGNEVSAEDYTVALLPGISVGYEEDFEGSLTGWSSYGPNNSWEHGTPTSGPGAALSGEKVYATNLAGNYANSSNMTLVMPPVDLPEGHSYLQFKQWHDLERNYDYGHVFVSTDMENWTQKLRVNSTSGGWIDGEVDLSEYAGQRVYVAFNVTTDGSVVKAGWYLDDVKLMDQPLAPAQKAKLGKGSVDKAPSLEAKPKVDPSKILPMKPTEEKEPSKDGEAAPMALPMRAEVSVLETGRSVYTNPQDGSYSLTHAAGTYTVKAEAYGFRSASQTVNLEADGTARANFTLEEIPKGTVSGNVTNQVTGEPVAGATVMLMEDAAVSPVETNEDGSYEIEAYEGEYTLKVVAPSYYGEEASVTIAGGGSTEQNFELKPFIGYPGEIGYDDGTAENARAFYDAGNGWAVKMSLAEGNEKAAVTGGLFRFWDTEWPVPGGTEFQLAVYDASGPDGAPGKKLAGPFDATALRNGEWTHVDLSAHGIMVEGDFYMVYIQSHPNPNTPGLGTDEDGEWSGRSYQLVGGAWSQSPEDEGNYMIRATVNYEVTAPVITSPADGAFTNQENVTVSGTAAPTTTVKIFNNGEEVASAATTDEGTFSADLTLEDGENRLTTKAVTEQGSTDESAPVTITLDQSKPRVSITSPEDGLKTNRESVTVTGTVNETNLDWIKVNGQKAKVDEEGNYSHRMLLNEGENVIKVVALDKAGNRHAKTVKVYAKFEAPVIENLKPDADKELKSGESVKIEFESEPGLDAIFVIHMPLTNAGNLANATELAMRETSEGHYEGYYTATSNVKAPGAIVEVIASDDYGNKTYEKAAGKLYINAKK